ncbi:bacteriophage CI repressor [Parashewanella curva]|uniref:Bacteriophage CI repressor n=1 Tax=Parashewanella curva TaxID=2338552 RepID=A0A3L8PU56_9GAMM|nr:helix-turn-helix transcriptional regulator [Parashewanella curva]RLV57948.1 bacteriophage CI repressor [Parashewanella curva]
MSNIVKLKKTKFPVILNQPIDCDSGKTIAERLIRLFGVRNRLELAEVLGMHPGSFSTWQTRNTTPYELLIRIHLATGAPMKYLCFGEGEGVPDVFSLVDNNQAIERNSKKLQSTDVIYNIEIKVINNGDLFKTEELLVDEHFLKRFRISGSDFAIEHPNGIHFINSKLTAVTKGKYLFSVNGLYEVGELRQLPDGHAYYFDGDDKYPIDQKSMKIEGKIVSSLEY